MHESSCPARPAACPWGCGAKVRFDELPNAEQHTREVSEQKVTHFYIFLLFPRCTPHFLPFALRAQPFFLFKPMIPASAFVFHLPVPAALPCNGLHRSTRTTTLTPETFVLPCAHARYMMLQLGCSVHPPCIAVPEWQDTLQMGMWPYNAEASPVSFHGLVEASALYGQSSCSIIIEYCQASVFAHC